MSVPVAWSRDGGGVSWADTGDVHMLVSREARLLGNKRVVCWSAVAWFGEWKCVSRHPTEADARAACERMAERIGGER